MACQDVPSESMKRAGWLDISLPGSMWQERIRDMRADTTPDSLSHRLAQAVLDEDEDAIWPLIDSILESRDKPADYPTSVEMLAVFRGYIGWLRDNISRSCDRTYNEAFSAMKDIVTRAVPRD